MTGTPRLLTLADLDGINDKVSSINNLRSLLGDMEQKMKCDTPVSIAFYFEGATRRFTTPAAEVRSALRRRIDALRVDLLDMGVDYSAL